jgi:hypothetical protein
VTFEASAAQVRASGTLGTRPLVVLTAREQGLPHDIAAPAEASWQKMQAELAQLSSTSRHIVVDGMGQYIHCEQPCKGDRRDWTAQAAAQATWSSPVRAAAR